MSGNSSSMTLVKQGAEALVYKGNFLQDTPCLLKVRPKKGYRHPTLDQRLTRHRCISEARLLYRCRGLGVPCPALYFVDEVRGEIFMEWIEGESIREALDVLVGLGGREGDEAEGMDAPKLLMQKIGAAVSRLHEVDIVHGDLTTSNILLKQKLNLEKKEITATTTTTEFEVILIDFGLGFVSGSDEDKAVDLYVLERAFSSTHPYAETLGLFKVVLDSYEKSFSGSKGVLKRLREVRLRGRKRSMVG